MDTSNSPIPTVQPCTVIYTPTAPCGCGFVQTVAHFPGAADWRDRTGVAPCPTCGEYAAIPSPRESWCCSRDHEAGG